MKINMSEKPQPKLNDGQTACKCHRCSGTGIYAQMILDGQPYGPHGTTCWSCGGQGWQIRHKRGHKPALKVSVPVYDETGKIIFYR